MSHDMHVDLELQRCGLTGGAAGATLYTLGDDPTIKITSRTHNSTADARLFSVGTVISLALTPSPQTRVLRESSKHVKNTRDGYSHIRMQRTCRDGL